MSRSCSLLYRWLTQILVVTTVFVSVITPARAAGSELNDVPAWSSKDTSLLALSVSSAPAVSPELSADVEPAAGDPAEAPASTSGTAQGDDDPLADMAGLPASSPSALPLIDLDTVQPIVVETEEGVYYTTNFDASSPVWHSLNAGLVIDNNSELYDAWDMWYEVIARPDWWTGSIWAATPTGIWLLSNPFYGGTWEQRLSCEEFWAKVEPGSTPDCRYFQVVSIEGSLDRYGTIYALVRKGTTQLWVVGTHDRFATWDEAPILSGPSSYAPYPTLAVAQHSKGQTLYISYRYGLWDRVIRKSIDGGESFTTVLFDDNSYNKSLDDMDIPYVSPAWNDSRIYAVGSAGNDGNYSLSALTSENGSTTWSSIGFATPHDVRYQVQANPYDADILAFKTAYTVALSIDGGQSWSQFGGGTSELNRLNSFSTQWATDGDLSNVLLGVSVPADSPSLDAQVYLNEGGSLIDKTGNLAASGTMDDIWFIGQVPPMAPQLPDSTWGGGECPYASCLHSTDTAADPVNTFTGNFTHQDTDISISTLGEPLFFERSYNAHSTGVYSEFVVYDEALGPGWTHNYATNLVFSGTVGGEADTVILRAPKGSRLRFFDYGEGHYVAYPGVYATLTREGATAPYTYTVTAFDQERLVFDTSGRLRYRYDPKGNVTSFSYDGSDRLSRVTDSTSSRYLDFEYDANDHLIRVADHTGRDVEYGYNTGGELAVVTDTMGLPSTLSYTTAGTYDHLLEEIIGQDGQRVMENEYDSQGRVVRQWNALDEVTEIAYDPGTTVQAPGGTVTVTNDLGIVTVNHYNSRGVLVSQEDATGEVREAAYDGFFNRAAIQDENENVTLVHSNQNGQPESIQDAQGNQTQLTYDGWNNPTSLTNALTQTTGYQYEVVTRMVNGLVFTMTNLVTVTDSLSRTTLYAYNERGQVTRVTENYSSTLYPAHGPGDQWNLTTEYEYDSLGQRVTITDALDTVTRYEYDLLGRMVTTTVAAGTPLQRVTVNGYNNRDSLIRVTESYSATIYPAHGPGNQWNLATIYGYDALGRPVWVTDTLDHMSYTGYDPAGRLNVRVINYQNGAFDPAHPDEDIVTTYGYDAAGRLTCVTDTLDHVTRTGYDPVGRVVSTTANYVDGLFDPAYPDEDIVTFYGYDAVGNQTHVTDTLGYVTLTEYDVLNRPLTVTTNYTTSVGPDTNLKTVYGYDVLGNTVIVTDTGGRITYTEYDELNRPLTVTLNWVAGGTGPDQNQASLTVYNPRGQVEAQVQLSGTERITVTSYAYDLLGRQTVITDAMGNATHVVYDVLGRQAAVADAEENTVGYEYDAAGRLISTTNALPATTRYAYDVLGRRTVVTDTMTHAVHYGYDGLGRTIAVTNAAGTAHYTYDALGRRTIATDAAGVTTYSEYDALGRLIETQDELGNRTQYAYDALGRQAAITDANGIVTRYAYDARGLLLSVTENYTPALGSDAQTNVLTRYLYDRVGNRTVFTDALGHTTVYTYDGLNRPAAVADALGNVTAYAYDALGRRIEIGYPGAGGPLSVTTRYNWAGWPLQVSYPAKGDAPGFTVQYAYDRVGNRMAMTDTTGTTTWEYDALYRPLLISAPYTGTVGYGYDAVGNRTQLIYPTGQIVTYTYNSVNRLQQVEDWRDEITEYGYDNAGRLLTTALPNGVETAYTYDDAGRLVEIEHTHGEELLARYEYTLNAVGNRVGVTETLLRPAEELAGLPAGLVEADGTVRAPGVALLLPESYLETGATGMSTEAGIIDPWSAGPAFAAPMVRPAAADPSFMARPRPSTVDQITSTLPVTGTEEATPIVDFVGEPRHGPAPLAVQFAATVTAMVDSWAWDFGDGTASSETNPLHVYEAAGTYTVTLAAAGPSGIGVLTKEAYIVVEPAPAPQPPVVDFSADLQQGTAPLSVQFTAMVSGEVESYEWDFGDGMMSSEPNPVHLFERAGLYTVHLIVTGPGGTGESIRVDYIHIIETFPDVPGTITETDSLSSTTGISLPVPGLPDPGNWISREQALRASYQIAWLEEPSLPGVPAAWSTTNVRHGLRAYFVPSGLHITSDREMDRSWRWGMQLTGYGYAHKILQAPAAELEVENNRIAYRRDKTTDSSMGGLDEWYVNKTWGIEQGFTLASPPAGEGSGPLVFELALSGDLQAFLVGDPGLGWGPGENVFEFATPQGVPVLRYGGLRVYDAAGRELPAYMAPIAPASGQPITSTAATEGQGEGATANHVRAPLSIAGIQIVVDDRNAVYPITIDPLLTGLSSFSSSGNQVVFSDDLEATATGWDILEIAAVVPSGVVSGPVVVDTDHGTSNDAPFTVGTLSVPDGSGEGTSWSTDVSGTISTDTVWNSNVRVVGDVEVAAGVTLTITPGVTVFFAAGSDNRATGLWTDKAELKVLGKLVAEGTPAAPIHFTSDAAQQAAGDWGGVVISTDDTQSSIKHCVVRYARWGVVYWVNGQGTGTLSGRLGNCLFEDNEIGARINADPGYPAGGTLQISLVIEDNLFRDNTESGILIADGNGYGTTLDYTLIRNNIIENSGTGISLVTYSWWQGHIDHYTEVRNNTVRNCTTYGIDIQAHGSSDSSGSDTDVQPLVENNLLEGNNANVRLLLNPYGSDGTQVLSPTVRYNTIRDAVYGVVVEDTEPYDTLTPLLSHNVFYGLSSYAVYNETGRTITASHNYWGDTVPEWDAGPQAGDTYGDVITSSHLVSTSVPILSRIDPGAGQADDEVTLYGANLDRAQLEIGKTAASRVIAGQRITYTLTVTNSGPAVATNLLITDQIPTGASYISGGTHVGDVVSWTVSSLAAGSSTQVTFVVTASATITNADYCISADAGVSAAGSQQVVTIVSPPGFGTVIFYPDLEATVIGWNILEIAAVVPSGVVSGPVIVETDHGTSNEAPFTVGTLSVPDGSGEGTSWSTDVSGTISTDTVWNSNVRVVGDVEVAAGVTLTIAPGVTAFFAAGSDNRATGLWTDKTELKVLGKLIAEGTPAAPIHFTSDAAQKAAGDWGAIVISTDDAESSLKHAVIHYSEWGVAYWVDGQGTGTLSGRLSNCLFEDNRIGVRVTASPGYPAGGTLQIRLVIENNLFRNNVDYGILQANWNGYGTTLDHSLIQNNVVENSSTGIWLEKSTWWLGHVDDYTIVRNNTVRGCTFYGIDIITQGSSDGSGSDTEDRYTIEHNLLEDNGINLSLQLWPYGADGTQILSPTIRYNTIRNAPYGIVISDTESYDTLTPLIWHNVFYGLSNYAVDNRTARTIAANDNYWGDTVTEWDAGPQAGDVNGTVITSSHLVSTSVPVLSRLDPGVGQTDDEVTLHGANLGLYSSGGSGGEATTTVITYTYDPLNRLTGAEYSDGQSFEYEYDAVGNRKALTTTAGTTTYAYDDANRLTNVGGVSYTYDETGNLTNDGTYAYTWNAAGRLLRSASRSQMVEAQSITHTVVYTYNGDGVRRAMAVDGLVTYWTQDTDGLAEVLIEHTADGVTFYVLGFDRLAQIEGSAAEWFLGDALGSVRQLVDDDGAVVLARDYDPYGQMAAERGTGRSEYRFTGEQWDSYIEYLYLRARWYDPGTGRFVSQDPWLGSIQQPSSLHKYLYVSANPVNLVDPTGLTEWRPSTSREEQIIGRLYELGRPEVHLEYTLPWGLGRPDIVNSLTGDVWEIKPFDSGDGVLLAEFEAAIYAEALNRFRAGTRLGGSAGLLPQSAPNNWNTVSFRLGIGFPAMYIRGGTPLPNGAPPVHPFLDLLVFSFAPGSVTYAYIPKPEWASIVVGTWAMNEYFAKKLLQLGNLRGVPGGVTPICPIVPQFLVDPSHPYSPMNPFNCWKYPELCAPPVGG